MKNKGNKMKNIKIKEQKKEKKDEEY